MNDIKIKDIISRFNEKDEAYTNRTYEEIIEATGCEIIDSLYLGSYQGDLLMIVTKDYMFGVLSTGYGSCPACDKLKSCDNDNKRAYLAKELYESIMWKDVNEIIDYLENKDWQLEYYGGEKGLSKFIKNIKEQLIIRYLAKI